MVEQAPTTVDELIAIHLIAFEEAALLQKLLFFCTLTIAGIGIFFIFIENANLKFLLGTLAFIFALISAFLSYSLNKKRAYAERVRKATLLTKGLGTTLSDFECKRIRAASKSSEHAIRSKINTAYYASDLEKGPKRLVEMLEESAFWSRDLLEKCANHSWVYFSISLIITILVFLSYLHFGQNHDSEQNLAIIQAFIGCLTLLVSRDFFGKALAYSSAERAVDDVKSRLEVLKARDDTQILQDLYLVLGDYNSAVESAPLFLPGLYNRNKDRLEKLWAPRSETAEGQQL